MTKIIQRGRLVVLAAVLAAGYLGLCWRLVLLQVVRGDEIHDKAGRQHKLAVLKQPPRGDILDIKGNLLATSLSVKTVCVDPALLTNCQVEVARVVSPFLGVGEPELLRNFGNLARWVTNDNTARAVTNHCLVLQRHVPVETWTNLEQVLLWNYKLHCTNALARKQMALEARNASRGWKRWLPGRPRTKLARLNDKDKGHLQRQADRLVRLASRPHGRAQAGSGRPARAKRRAASGVKRGSHRGCPRAIHRRRRTGPSGEPTLPQGGLGHRGPACHRRSSGHGELADL
ncbi:MAG: hypothetical protein NTW03_18495 [Verrucomicrobia bacterium]|nr:hypothetical protein [Verrucomicrobiota bacterium]